MASVVSFTDLLKPLTVPVNRAEEAPLAPSQREWAREQARHQAEAGHILAQARAEAAELIGDAQVQAEALREAAWQEGLYNGEQAGRASAEANVRAEAEAQHLTIRQQWEALVHDFTDARQTLWQTQEQEMLALTLTIARQVIKTEVTQNPDVVRQVIANAVRRVVDKEMVRIRVCVGEAGRVREMRQDLLETLDGLHHLEIIDDRRISAGGCVIETNAGTIDAKIETQLGEIARALKIEEGGDE